MSNGTFPTMYRIGLLGPLRLSPNLEGVLLNLGRMLHGHFDLRLALGQGNEAGWLDTYYRVFPYRARSVDRAEILTSLNACRRFATSVRPHLLLNIINACSSGFAVASVGRTLNIPNIVLMSGLSFEEAAAHRHPWKRFKAWLLHDKMAGLAYQRAGHIITVGERLKEALILRGIDSARISVLPQPVDTDRFRPLTGAEKETRKAAFGLEPERKTILYAGRLSWLKGADRILEIITAVGARSRAFQFCLIGEGAYRRRFMGFPEELVRVTGYVPHRHVSDYFQAADLVIFPSRTEGLPNTVLEALACRVPVIAAPVGDIPNWVTRLATEPDDYIDYILKGEWAKTCLPATMEFDRLREAYIRLFNDVIERKA